MAADLHPYKVASVLLQYPDPEIVEAMVDFDPGQVSPLKRGQARALDEFLAWFRERPIAELREAYVSAFDFNRSCSLHLTYHLHGDSRQRGLALLKIKSRYRESGFSVADAELPDFLPVMLEFAALAPEPAGRDLLDSHRESLELIREGLAGDSSPYEALLGLIVSSLPRLSSRQAKRIRRLAAEGPPSEQVGLDPFAPPEVMPHGPGQIAEPLVGGRP